LLLQQAPSQAAPPVAPEVHAACALAAPALVGAEAQASTWIARAPSPDEVVLSAEEIGDANVANEASPSQTPRDLSRRALLEAAFSALSSPCKEASCRSFAGDILEKAFGFSAPKGKPLSGSFSLDLATLPKDADRLRLLDDLSTRYVVLVETRDRSWLFLGKDASGAPVALGGVANPKGCSAASKASPAVFSLAPLVSRVERLQVFGKAPSDDLLGVAALRPAASVRIPEGESCSSQEGAALFFSPKQPNRQQALRVVVTSQTHPGPAALSLLDPSGKTHTPTLRRLGGPPFAYVATIEKPDAGSWRAVFGDGQRVLACAPLEVKEAAPKPKKKVLADPVWPNEHAWNADFENLYAAWVESLFSYPLEQDLTWNDLHTLLLDQEKNFLYGHFSRDEEAALTLEPDCADLPVALRTYFAWKLGLPYGNRECDRGKAGQPPECEPIVTFNTMKRRELGLMLAARSKPKKSEESEKAPASPPPSGETPASAPVVERKLPTKAVDDVVAFQMFVRDTMAATNSGSGRTAPNNSATDYYPVPLTREALRPGTVFADPYGHIMILVQWVPQTFDKYGLLMGADAQPDSTVGRRRFWRGSFLFTASTKDVGAGFKAYRPLRASGKGVVALSNKKLSGENGFVPFSEQQYTGSTDDFYDQIDGLANPRPLDALDMQRSLLDSLAESVSRRVTAVQNGEDFMKQEGYKLVEMPQGYAIFETSGPWEDFATPSRDMRLLISIDTVMRFSEAVRRTPGRFGLSTPEAIEAAIAALDQERDKELSQRTFTYQRTDGSPWKLRLQDVVTRQKAYEVGYNPNDCPEARWGAEEGSEEAKTCTRRANKKQVKLLESYRNWFATRQRPPRGT
jgi:hypothetical protein